MENENESERECELKRFKVLRLLSSIIGQNQEIFSSMFCFCKWDIRSGNKTKPLENHIMRKIRKTPLLEFRKRCDNAGSQQAAHMSYLLGHCTI